MRPTKPAPTRPEVTTVGVRLKTRERLRRYIEEQSPRLVMTDVVSIAVERYIDHKMCDSILEQTQAFRGGMLDVLQEPGLLALFTPAELGELLGGTAGIDEVAVAR